MTNQYTGRSFDELMEHCGAEFRFHRNSLRNFRPRTISGVQVADLEEYFQNGVNQPKQSFCLNLPAVCIDDDSAHFDFPANLHTILAGESTFSIEYYGVPQDRGMNASGAVNVMSLIGENAGIENISLIDDGRIQVNLGAATITSDGVCWWWKDAILHWVITKEAGDDPGTVQTRCYANGSEVAFASHLAGDGGFSSANGQILGWTDGPAVDHGMYGHHFLLRFYDTELTKPEVLELYQDVQQMLPQHLHHIPIHEVA